MDSRDGFDLRFEALTGVLPFPWQQALYQKLVSGEIPASCNLPTGLGKTSVIAIWLIALAHGANVPRRLVYVVNRRTVVDQTTEEAERLRRRLNLKSPEHELEKQEHRSTLTELAASLSKLCTAGGDSPLAISTLRGQFADNREWSADPSRPAIICGTVDMIGSRLLFSGYGLGFKSRPLHAGLLGQDVLLVHDEAHLEPAFQRLIESIRCEQVRCHEFARFHVMELTATRRSDDEQAEEPFGLTEDETQPPKQIPEPADDEPPIYHVWRRLTARKALRLTSVEGDKDAAERIADVAARHRDANATVLVFVRTLDDVKKVCDKLADRKAGVGPDRVQQLTGTMRGLERDALADCDPVFMRFLPAKNRNRDVKPIDGTVYLVCTSAGEVGVDLSADHMVCDLSTLESMAQRFGRVNRYGDRGDTDIDVVYPAEFNEKDKLTPARQATLQLLTQLKGDASPQALGRLMASLTVEQRMSAFAPEPTILAATDILFDSWALTSIKGPMPGRPPVEPYLHGIAEWQPPETRVAWREDVEIITGDFCEQYAPADLLDDYPLMPHEQLSDRSDRVFKHLEVLAEQHAGKSVWVVDDRGGVDVATLGELADKRHKDRINGCTIVLPPSVGGLSSGMFDSASSQADDVADGCYDANKGLRRKRFFSDDPKPDGPPGMALIRTIDTDPDADERETPEDDADVSDEASESAPSKRGRYWHWYTWPREAEDATRASTVPIRWDNHTRDVVQRTTEIVRNLRLDNGLSEALILAAELHDLGKRRELWQRSIGNPNPAVWYAKPGKPATGSWWRPLYLSDYRHEFGSLLDAQADARFNALADEMKDLVLHLVAAHHGRARPHFTPDESLDPNPPSGVSPDDMAVETPRRFARLQRRYGRWGLAYLESLLRAADWAASDAPSADGDNQEAMQ